MFLKYKINCIHSYYNVINTKHLHLLQFHLKGGRERHWTLFKVTYRLLRILLNQPNSRTKNRIEKTQK